MSEESDLVAKIITNDINTLVEDLNNVIKAHNVLVEENQQLKDRINKALECMDKMTEKELNYITYKGEEHLVCGSDFSDGAWIIEEILKGDKE